MKRLRHIICIVTLLWHRFVYEWSYFWRHVGYFLKSLLPSERRKRQEELDAESTRLAFEFLTRLKHGLEREAIETYAYALNENDKLFETDAFKKLLNSLPQNIVDAIHARWLEMEARDE